MNISPILYTADVEHHEEDEEKIAAEIAETMVIISKTTYHDSGHAMRSVHAKSHALLHGQLVIYDALPVILAQGMFSQAASYSIVMRFSTTPGDLLPDSVSTPRGLAIKVIGIKGERLPGAEGSTTQDFLMVNGPAFLTPTAKIFLRNLKLLAATTDKGEGAKVAFSSVLRRTEKVIEALGSESSKIKSLGGELPHHPLGETYFTQVPMLYGPYMGKLSLAPISSELIALTEAPVDISQNRNALREAMLAFFATHGGEWEIRVQLCTDLQSMPIEDASIV